MKKWLLRSCLGLGGLILVVALLVLTGIVPLGTLLATLGRVMIPHEVTAGWADLRNEVVRSASPATVERGHQLLSAAAEAHGRAVWQRFSTLEIEARDLWADPGPWWPAQNQTYRAQRLIGTFTSRVELLDGPKKGQVWGIQAWHPYKRETLTAEPIFLEETDWPIRFYLPTLHYFDEIPLRLLEADIIVDAGPAELDGKLYDRVFVTWETLEPSGKHDQYIAWISRDSGLIEKLHYTVREAVVFAPEFQQQLMMAGAAGTMHFEDYRDVQGVQFPFRQVVTLFGPEQVTEPLAENFLHLIEVSSLSFDTVPPEALMPDPALPRPADRKGNGSVSNPR